MKLLALILSILLTLSACGAEPQQPSNNDPSPVISAEVNKAPDSSAPSAASYEIGDIILTDGSIVKAYNFERE